MAYEMPSESYESAELLEQSEFLEDGLILEHIGFHREGLEKTAVQESYEASDMIYGDPEADAKNWHPQSESMSCAVSCQEFVAEQLTGMEFHEKDFINFAQSRGWYDPESGTAVSDTGKILESLGINVERGSYTLQELAEELESGSKVICGVNNKVLQNPAYAEMPGLRANHAVQLCGIDASVPSKVEVILNDPGVKNGAGLRVPIETFMKAWNTGDKHAIIASKGVSV